nr:cysteine-rich receptor-like protein kinase [Tanacetum cinerariifolium]
MSKLDRHLSDHRPIIMRKVAVDYGLSPFNIYHSWFNKKGFDKLVEDSWSSTNTDDSNIVNVVREFFNTIKFPPGCNSSFIALIPKKKDAKFVKDVRPISLIGCFYKIIAKILANLLNMVISNLISNVQSAFVPNRQILDGLFILNEIISWCKSHKSKVMIFKVDFEKAFDSVRWDYLDGILSNFGFGTKWRGWIQSCLSSARGSILVNGSPTSKFQFHKGSTSSPWYCIIKELGSLSSKGINLLAFLKKNMENRKNIIVAEKLNDAALITSFRSVPRGGVEDDQFVQLCELVGPISLSDSKDRWTWILDSSGKFFVHSARTYIDNTLLPDVGPPTRWVK